MNRTLSGVAVALIALLTIPYVNAGANGVKEQHVPRVKAFVIDARLRSAFIQRLTGLQFSPLSATAEERTEELQRHFDAVVGILEANRERSVNLALQRLEKRRGETWDAKTRQSWQTKLKKERERNLTRLESYRDRGLFPVNEHVPGCAVPVFVDNVDTACAVGHLMRLSGWEQEVTAIQAASNLVYVNDVAYGPLVDWLATSGMTQEEAALIQPAYEPPPENATFQSLMAGASVSKNGLRYENFQVLPGFAFDLAIVGVSAHDDVYISPSGPGMAGQFDDWLFLGATQHFGGPFSGGVAQAPADGTLELAYSFEVVAEQPGKLIDAATLESIAIFNFNSAANGSVQVSSLITDPMFPGVLATLEISADSGLGYFMSDSDVASFAPKQRIRVATFVELQNEATFTSLTYSFNATPEPATGSLCLAGGVAVAICRRKRIRCS